MTGSTADPVRRDLPDAPADPDAAQGSGGVAAQVARMTGQDLAPSSRQRSRELGSLVKGVADSARTAGRASVMGGGWLVELFLDIVPRIPVRDAETLRAQHPGLGPDDLAQTLIAGAAKATGAVGAAGGALAAVEFAAPPTLLTTPVQLAAETLLVAAVEVKLIAELHEVFGVPVAGSTPARMQAYLMAWTERRGVDPFAPGVLRLSLGVAAKRSLRKRLLKRVGRNLSTLGPMMSGAVAGSLVNHRETRRVGEQVRDDLRRPTRQG